MKIIGVFNNLIKHTFNALGFDIIRANNNPDRTLLGLRNLSIRTIIDVGANEGQFARRISEIFPEANLYCFEPLPESFKKLKKWAEDGKIKVKCFNIALGEQEGTGEMFYHENHSPSSSLLMTTEICEKYYPFTKKQRTIQVKMTTLDKWIETVAEPLENEILIKLDVQGYEDRVIKGGSETFKKAKACILEVCLDKLYKNQADFRDIVKLLYDIGFSYAGNLNQTYAEDGHVIFIDALFIKNA